ncbi:MAG: nucleotide exchange factor GrpE, partial [Candidatus Omnitrophica bacterium]|nr:nucleotide exchange factor GrpE [Candidatus Omnitrophota bacterium]
MEEEKNNHKTPEEHPAEEHHKSNPKKEEKTVTLNESEYLGLLEEVKKGRDGWDKMLRNQADLENARKRIEKEKQEFIKFANEGLILDLLNVLDDLERTVDLAETGKE